MISHGEQYAIIASLTQGQSCDFGDCDSRKVQRAAMENALLDRHAIFGLMAAAGLNDKEIAETLGSTQDKISKSRKDRQLQEPEMALAFKWLLDRGFVGSIQAAEGAVSQPPQPTIPTEQALEVVARRVAAIWPDAPAAEADYLERAQFWHAILSLLSRRPALCDDLARLEGAIDLLVDERFGPGREKL